MSAPLHSLIADELGVSEDRARKLLYAMLREVRKRASRGKGVHLPDLGTFTEEDGALTFTPSDALARSVNKRFAGLGSEAVSIPDEEEVQEEASGITTGFQSRPSGSSGGADTDEFEAPDTDEIEAPDTDEFSAPDTNELQAPDTDELDAPDSDAFSTPDTDELQAPDTDEIDAPSSSSSPSEKEASGPRRSGTGPIEIPDVSSYSASEDASPDDSAPAPKKNVPEPSSASSREAPSTSGRSLYDPPPESPSAEEDEPVAEEEDDDTGGSIWDDDSAWDFSTASYDDDPEGALEDESEDATPKPVSEPADEAEEPAVPLREESRPPQESRGDRTSVTAQPESSSGSGVGKALIALVVTLMIVGGVWFVLGQQGYVPAPGSIFSNTNVTQPVTDRGAGEPSADASGDASSSATNGSASAAPASSDEPFDAQASASSQPTESTQTTPPTDSQTGAQASIRDGWTIVVASRTTESAAQELVSTFRSRFASDNLPVDVVAGQTDAGTRYRVAVGRFTSGDAARSAINRYQDRLPQGAWPLEVQ